MTTTPTQGMRVAVIGSGAAGLAAARVLSRQGLTPFVLEKEAQVGGVWSYKQEDKTRPMYRGLRTNLPREIMGYREYPWGSTGQGKSYVTHREVLQYLQDYKTEFELERFIDCGCKVTQLRVLKEKSSKAKLGDEELSLLEVEWQKEENCHKQTFDAVCVANGHYAKPAFAHVEGLNHFTGNVMHSMEYDDPSQFQGQTVLCIGGRASGSDLAREISHHAQHVFLSDTTCPSRQPGDKVTLVPKTNQIHKDGSIEFQGEAQDQHDATHVDTIVFCTGYDYSFPFLSDPSNLDLEFVQGERRVQPLYQQLWHADHPNLAFVGLPHSVLPFPLFELQVEAWAHQLLTANHLPSRKERREAAQIDAQAGGPNPEGRIQDTHFLGGHQWDYCRQLARLADNLTPQMENYLATNKAIYDHAGAERKTLIPGGPDTYRSTCYTRDNEQRSFQVVATEMKVETEATAAK